MEGPNETVRNDQATSPIQPQPPSQHARPKSSRATGAEKTFKACRTCRRQKMRCEGQPCTRCVTSGVECIFDNISAKRPPKDKDTHGNPKRKRLDELESELQQLRNDLGTNGSDGVDPPGSANKVADRRESPGGATAVKPVDKEAPDLYGLTPDDLRAPVTAMHAMSPESIQQQESKRGFFPSFSNPSLPVPKPGDFISEGLVNEAQARGLFNLFMTGSNCFLPIFDPALDTFDSLRARSPFCLSVILAAAARAEDGMHDSDNLSQICQNEARRLAAETLFVGIPQLEDVQAMAILAAFSERTWFAIGHATQMALVLGLQHAFPQLLKRINSNDHKTRKEDRILIANARTWLTVLHIELEIAAGTAHRPRLEHIDPTKLKLFSTYPFLRPSDLRILAIVDAVELRGRLQKEIEESGDLLETAMSKIRQMAGQFQRWWSFWDHCLEEHDYPQSSFQRIGLILQKDYATILTCCAALRKIQQLSSKKVSPNQENQSLDSTASEILTYVSNIIVEMLSFLLQSPAYRWNLKWAPTYSVLIIAFSTAFALKVSRLNQDLVDQSRLYSLAEEVAKILQTHPHKNFYRLIQLLLSLPRDIANFQEGTILGASNNLGDSIVVQPFDRFKAFSFNKSLGGQNSQMQSQGSTLFQSPSMYAPENILSTSSNQEGRENDVAGTGEPFDTQQQQYKFSQRNWNNLSNLEPSWIFDNSSIGSFGLPNQGNASVFDFDLPLIMENDPYLQQQVQ